VTDLLQTVVDRLQHIAQLARCEGCGATRAECDRLFEQNAPDPIGCCTGYGGSNGCAHPISTGTIGRLVSEIEGGEVKAPKAQPQRKGVSIYTLLNQSEFWWDKNGVRHRVREMEPTHRYNCLRLLERGATRSGKRYSWGFLASGMGPLGPSGDAACDAFEQASWELDREIERDPVAWIRTTDLWQALNAGLPGNPYKRWRLAQRARHWPQCHRRQHNRGICTCTPKR
jgi:hypothetical protein